MTENKASDAQARASRKWEENNKEYARKKSYFRTAKTYARKHATRKDMEELMEIFENENKNASEDEDQEEVIQDDK